MFKKIKAYFEKKKQKEKDYWDNLDLDREEKIWKIKKSKYDCRLKDSKGFFFYSLAVISIFLAMPIYFLIYSHIDFDKVDNRTKAYAEEINISTVAYEDIVNDSTAIVNFNQVINITGFSAENSSNLSSINNCSFKINSSLSNGATALFTNNVLIADHKYYIFGKNNQAFRPVDTNGNTFGSAEDLIFIPSTNRTLYYYNYNSIYGSYNVGDVVSFNIIDLTIMFGSGNEPTLEQAQELFISDYYSYDTGSAVSLSGLNAYAEGVQSVYDTLTYNYVGEDSYNLLQSYAFYRGATYYNGAPSKEQSHISVASVDGDGWSSGNGFALYYPFTSSLVAGDSIVLNGMLGSATDLGLHQQATTYVIIRYGENIYDVLSVDNIVLQDADSYNINSYTYTLPSDATGLVFYSIQPFRIKDFTIQVKSLSVNNLIDSAYKNGYENGSNPYRVGNNGYNQIFEAGRLQGVQDAGDYTFLGLLTTSIDVPINSVLHMLDFDLLGMNMKSFYLSMFTFAIIVFVIKLLI